MIVDEVFEKIMHKLGPCDIAIDLFASKHNYRLKNYVSYEPDLKAMLLMHFL